MSKKICVRIRQVDAVHTQLVDQVEAERKANRSLQARLEETRRQLDVAVINTCNLARLNRSFRLEYERLYAATKHTHRQLQDSGTYHHLRAKGKIEGLFDPPKISETAWGHAERPAAEAWLRRMHHGAPADLFPKASDEWDLDAPMSLQTFAELYDPDPNGNPVLQAFAAAYAEDSGAAVEEVQPEEREGSPQSPVYVMSGDEEDSDSDSDSDSASSSSNSGGSLSE